MPIIKKFNFNAVTKLYINEKLIPMNEAIAFNCKKLRRSNIIHSCHTREGILHIKHEESSKAFLILHIFKLYELFSNFFFVYDDKVDVSTTVLSRN